MSGISAASQTRQQNMTDEDIVSYKRKYFFSKKSGEKGNRQNFDFCL